MNSELKRIVSTLALCALVLAAILAYPALSGGHRIDAAIDLSGNTSELKSAFYQRGYDAKWTRYDETYVHDYGSAAPSTGYWEAGCIIWDTAPEAGGTVGWVCVTTGTPGTWKAFGSIAQ